MIVKKCTKCNVDKPLKEFPNRLGANGKNRKQRWCLECFREVNKQNYNKNAAGYISKRRNRVKKHHEYIKSFKVDKCCEKCGESRIVCLDFHHINPLDKKGILAAMAHHSLKIIDNEIDKCIIICSNCHREWHSIETEYKSIQEWIKERN